MRPRQEIDPAKRYPVSGAELIELRQLAERLKAIEKQQARRKDIAAGLFFLACAAVAAWFYLA